MSVFQVVLLGGLAFLMSAASVVASDEQAGAVLISSDITDLREQQVADVLLKANDLMRSQVLSDESRFRQLVDATYLTEAAAAEAVTNGLDQDPVVAARIERSKKDILANAQIEMLVAKEMEGADLGRAAKEYYQAHPEEFTQEPMAHAAHILFKELDQGASAEERAKEVLSRITAGELSFEEAAKEHSGDVANAAKGGDLGWVKKGQMVPPFEKALFAIEQPGSVVGPIKTRFGFHLIQLKASKGGGVAPFDTVADSIKKKLTSELSSTVRQEYLIGLRDDSSAKVQPQSIRELFEKEKAKFNIGR